MPAPRTCRACGAPLPGAVRWCLRCYTPAHEYAPRAPLHEAGSIAETPKHTEVTSRTKASATTWGLAGRVAITVVIGLMTLNTLQPMLQGGFFWLPFFTIWCGLAASILRQTWKAVPVNDAFQAPKVRLGDIWRAAREEPGEPPPRRTTTMKVWRVVIWVAGAAAALVFSFGPVPARAAVLFGATLVGVVWFLYGFFSAP